MRHSHRLGGVILALLTVGLDQLTKGWVLASFATGASPLTVTFFWKIVLTFNRGVSFGLFSQDAQRGVYFLIGLTSLVTLGLVVWLVKSTRLLSSLGLGLIIGGSLGNIMDRVQFGAVVDFLYFHWHNHGFPAFNLADSGITIGVGFILLDSVLSSRRS